MLDFIWKLSDLSLVVKAGLRELRVSVKFDFRSESFKQKSTSILFFYNLKLDGEN